MGVDEALEDPGVHGNIPVTSPGYSLRSCLFFPGVGRYLVGKTVLPLPPFSILLSF